MGRFALVATLVNERTQTRLIGTPMLTDGTKATSDLRMKSQTTAACSRSILAAANRTPSSATAGP